MTSSPPRRGRRGFSLIEMLAAVTILSMLALMGVPYAQSSKDRELEMSLRDTLTRLRFAINSYAWNEDATDEDGDGIFGEDPAGDPDGDGLSDDDRDGNVDEDGAPTYPASLTDLVTAGYLSVLPRDPLSTDPTVTASSTWTTVTITRDFRWRDRTTGNPMSSSQTGILDVRSKSFGRGLDGTLFGSW